MLPNLPGILEDATKTLKTNFPPDQLSAMLDLARKTSEASIKRVVLDPPTYTTHPDEHHQRLHPGPEHGQHRQDVDQHLRARQSLLHGPELTVDHVPEPSRSQRPAWVSIAGIVRATILRSSHSDQWSM